MVKARTALDEMGKDGDFQRLDSAWRNWISSGTPIILGHRGYWILKTFGVLPFFLPTNFPGVMTTLPVHFFRGRRRISTRKGKIPSFCGAYYK